MKIFYNPSHMPVFQRIIDLKNLASNKSVLLLGPRQVGKSTLIQEVYPDALFITLLKSNELRTFATTPEVLRERVEASGATTVILDEIQRLPELLNEVHYLIEENKKLRFILTGSSARKLKRQEINLLGGRARRLFLAPITFKEIHSAPESQTLFKRMLQFGGLPSILLSPTPKEDLQDYVDVYLKEEIQSEALVRSLPDFARFLNAAALCNTEQLNFTAVASDAQIKVTAVKEYFNILEDTLIGKLLPPFLGTPTRKAMASPKFYFFDVGVANALLKRWETQEGTPEFGKVFEHLIWRELESAVNYLNRDIELSYWRSLSKLEVDFVISEAGQKVPFCAIEVKGKKVVRSKDFTGLLSFSEDYPKVRKIVVCLEEVKRKTQEGIEIWPVQEFLAALWRGEEFRKAEWII